MATERPRRRTSPAVYRRRRLVLLLGILIVVGLVIWLFIAQPWSGSAADGTPASPSPSASPSGQGATDLPVPVNTTPEPEPTATLAETPTSSPSPSPSASATTPSAGPCVASEIDVVAVTDKESYQPGENPQLSIQLTNRSAEDCTLNVGTTTQSFTVSSGDDTWWRSTDCQTEPSDMVVLLTAGQTVASASPLVWDRTRSSVDTCSDPNRQRAPGGGASYHVSVEIGGIPSTETRQMLLY